MTIVVGAVKADGQVSREEVIRLRSMCALSPVFMANTGEQDGAVISFADNVTTQLGDEAIARAIEVLTPELRETAFAFACDMILADGVLGRDEEVYITKLASKCAIPDETGKAIIYTTIVRNRSAS
jgi:uncharacterized tellurite resistance protein B-like protein